MMKMRNEWFGNLSLQSVDCVEASLAPSASTQKGATSRFGNRCNLEIFSKLRTLRFFHVQFALRSINDKL